MAIIENPAPPVAANAALDRLLSVVCEIWRAGSLQLSGLALDGLGLRGASACSRSPDAAGCSITRLHAETARVISCMQALLSSMRLAQMAA